jgi:hypothetical protein
MTITQRDTPVNLLVMLRVLAVLMGSICSMPTKGGRCLFSFFGLVFRPEITCIMETFSTKAMRLTRVPSFLAGMVAATCKAQYVNLG